MSKISQILIGIMLAALCYMGAVRAYQFYTEQVALQQARAEQAQPSSFVRAAQEVYPTQKEIAARIERTTPGAPDFADNIARILREEL